MKMICSNINVKNGELYFANINVTDLAKKYGTPLYLMDGKDFVVVKRETMDNLIVNDL